MNWKLWLKSALIRAVKTISQTAIAMIGTSLVMSEVNWVMVISASLLAGILSMLTSLAGLPEVKQEKVKAEKKSTTKKSTKKSTKKGSK